MDHEPLVSVIIPAFNASKYIGDAIESVLAQTWANIEIIVVDDGSTDHTLEVIDQYKSKIKLLRSAHAGPSAARNAGIQVSQGDYLVFLDADDLILPEKLAKQAEFLLSHPNVGVVYSGGYRLWRRSDGSDLLVSFDRADMLTQNLGAPEVTLAELVIQNAFPIHCAMCRREIVKDAGGFDHTLLGLEDWDLWLRLAPSTTFAYLPGDVAVYRYVPASVTYQPAKQALAYRRICEKIELADWFGKFSANLRARFFLNWGIHELSVGTLDEAKILLLKARRNAPDYLPALLFNVAIKFMGKRALVIYKLKRSMLGPHTIWTGFQREPETRH